MNGDGDFLLSYDSPNEYGSFPSGVSNNERKQEREGGALALPCVLPGYMTDFEIICPEEARTMYAEVDHAD